MNDAIERMEILLPAEAGSGIRRTVDRGLALLERLPHALLALAFRGAIAGVFLRAGLQKVGSWELTLQLFREEYQVPLLPPEVAATLASCTEIGCSLLLLCGLATRLATLPLLGMILVIQTFVYPDAWPEHLTWASILLFLLARGPGSLSLDHLLGIERR